MLELYSDRQAASLKTGCLPFATLHSHLTEEIPKDVGMGRVTLLGKKFAVHLNCFGTIQLCKK